MENGNCAINADEFTERVQCLQRVFFWLIGNTSKYSFHFNFNILTLSVSCFFFMENDENSSDDIISALTSI